MKRHRWLSMMLVMAVLSALLMSTASAKSRTSAGVVISPHTGIGFWIGRDVESHRHRGPYHHPKVIPGLWRHRMPAPWTPRPRVVIVPPPVVERVVIPAPPVIRCEPTTITVWITNSNGSTTSVQLTREGSWYRGPQGEYYATMPTNEQLRVVYGF